MENNKLTGGQPNKYSQTEYTLVKKLDGIIIVRDGEGKLELWAKHSDVPASFHLIVDGENYEFVTSDRAQISSKLKSVIQEMTSTGAVAGYSTPFAFTKNKNGNVNAAKSVSGYTLVEDDSTSELVNEGRYSNFKKHPMKNEAKISLSLREVNRILKEVESLVNMNTRLKTEGSISGPYWKRSAQDVSAIRERTKNIVKGIGQIVRGKINEATDVNNAQVANKDFPTTNSVAPETSQSIENSTNQQKVYTISIDFLNFENDISGVITKHEDIISKKVINKQVTCRASKGYGQVEKDYSILVKHVAIVLYKEKYNLIFKDQNKKEYYVNTAFKMHIDGQTTPTPSPEQASPKNI
jgi:hypothetical protein